MGLLKLFFISIILMPVIAAPPPPLPTTSDSEKDPVEKKKLLVMALGNDQESKMLKSELFRDWTKPNSEVILSKKQAEQNLKLGKLLKICSEIYTIVSVQVKATTPVGSLGQHCALDVS